MRLYPFSFLGLACCFWRWWRGTGTKDNDELEDEDQYPDESCALDKILASPTQELFGKDAGIAGSFRLSRECEMTLKRRREEKTQDNKWL